MVGRSRIVNKPTRPVWFAPFARVNTGWFRPFLAWQLSSMAAGFLLHGAALAQPSSAAYAVLRMPPPTSIGDAIPQPCASTAGMPFRGLKIAFESETVKGRYFYNPFLGATFLTWTTEHFKAPPGTCYEPSYLVAKLQDALNHKRTGVLSDEDIDSLETFLQDGRQAKSRADPNGVNIASGGISIFGITLGLPLRMQLCPASTTCHTRDSKGRVEDPNVVLNYQVYMDASDKPAWIQDNEHSKGPYTAWEQITQGKRAPTPSLALLVRDSNVISVEFQTGPKDKDIAIRAITEKLGVQPKQVGDIAQWDAKDNVAAKSYCYTPPPPKTSLWSTPDGKLIERTQFSTTQAYCLHRIYLVSEAQAEQVRTRRANDERQQQREKSGRAF